MNKDIVPAQVLVYTLSAAARELDLSPTQITRLLDAGVLTEATIVAGSGRYITSESVARYAALKAAR